ncbi:hypothetical protein SAMN04488082_101396 [Desulfomicrobium apsheronum]|uniref:Type 4 fimbrial biogenesis protein PilX N-terminal domain-containing protein n=1 Tax=Desulfomicrobium apsheronum TaxID=52560 RepID=A0A1I3NUN2_9BACT|nr:pilus assembly PilX N-terminal domain-containing protein [Desulfomicrobium apsheronum]SFJ12985.1 hypothetical protein SAMN04488082_101396 [Desulfomicrobium apsheronum]
MYTISVETRVSKRNVKGSALVIALIVLAILGALGLTALEVADLNIFMAANDRDAKEAFFHADSGVNIGRELTKELLNNGNTTILEDDAKLWYNSTIFSPSDYTLFKSTLKGTHVRAGLLDYVDAPHSIQYNDYISPGASLSKSLAPIFLIRSHNEGKRNSRAEVDLAWRDRPLM